VKTRKLYDAFCREVVLVHPLPLDILAFNTAYVKTMPKSQGAVLVVHLYILSKMS